MSSQSQRQGSTSAPRLYDTDSRHDVHLQDDTADIFGIYDLSSAAQVHDSIVERWFQRQKGISQVRIRLPAQRLADEVIVANDASVGVQLPAGGQHGLESLAILEREKKYQLSLPHILGQSRPFPCRLGSVGIICCHAVRRKESVQVSVDLSGLGAIESPMPWSDQDMKG